MIKTGQHPLSRRGNGQGDLTGSIDYECLERRAEERGREKGERTREGREERRDRMKEGMVRAE